MFASHFFYFISIEIRTLIMKIDLKRCLMRLMSAATYHKVISTECHQSGCQARENTAEHRAHNNDRYFDI